MPNRSVHNPKYAPQKASCNGMMTLPPADSPANTSSQCSLLLPSMATEKLLPTTSGPPNPVARSLPIRTLDPIGSDTCMTRSFSASGTLMSAGASAKVWNAAYSPPKTDR